MQWFYAKGDERIGPVDEDEFDRLVGVGVVGAETLVWNSELTDWKPYGEVAAVPPLPVSAAHAGYEACAECAQFKPLHEMRRFGDAVVCTDCAPPDDARYDSGIPAAGRMAFAGFGVRLAAKGIDFMILVGLFVVLGIPMYALLRIAPVLIFVVGPLGRVGILLAWNTLFIGKYGATPGKMACGLRVIRSGGGKVSYPRALGRAAAEFISGMFFFIGYIIAAFDVEKRTLHDRICDTRVIHS